MSPAIQAQTNSLLTGMWNRNIPLMRARLETLDRAVEAARSGSPDPALYQSAVDIAHKLAGSLGMFGFARGTDLARELEAALESHAASTQRLELLVSDLRATIFPNS
ncbi:Hpt domain-containing protein [Granulicella tundricola]|uniref:Hpt domain protein n=1 Tax=Granulicella tundricola (strain ATCC BAA-1859 / DSM 23138 / MP5ACTX9) TaxID=1198114 RepID=E8X2X7_GRATM|nr:Hpt domain-containing protein [Granulicella tundricola]ADW68111.1 Hpt domain protein [Granulicella tundricola MP5ACTX9]